MPQNSDKPRRSLFLEYARAPKQFLQDYFWFILKNVIGWTLILAAWPIGLLIPGPGGIPIFLIGFAMVTFPGKRKFTARVLRGRRVQIQARVFTILSGIIALAVPAITLWVLLGFYGDVIREGPVRWPDVLGIFFLIVAITWLVTRLSLSAVNAFLRGMPKLRRKVRPWLRDHGVHLLPPRRRRRPVEEAAVSDEEIIEIHERHHHRLRYFWASAKPWVRRAVILAITVVTFLLIIRPIAGEWQGLKDRILSTSLTRFFLAAAMFAVFLFLFRAMTWRRILIGFNHRLPVPAAARIWSISEMARYLPGVVWQVVGRVYMVRPYGVSALTSSTSQLIEVAIFLLANLIVAVSFLVWYSANLAGQSRHWFLAALAIVPALFVLLHPKVFYGIIDRALRMMNKPPMARQLSGNLLVGLLAWSMLGLLWQSLAVWVLLSQPETLGLRISLLGVVAGAYCLAWSAGFMAFWAPGGIGVREVVLVATLRLALPDLVVHFSGREEDYLAFLAFLSLLLRLWTIVGEIIICSISYIWDHNRDIRRPIVAEAQPDEPPVLERSGSRE